MFHNQSTGNGGNSTKQADRRPYQGIWSERGEKAEVKLEENTFDMEAWNVLIKENQLKRSDEARMFYERLVDKFPVTGRFWKIYIDHEMKARNFDKVEKLFQRCLTKVLHIELWKLYLLYIKETKCTMSNFGEKMAKAYDFALDKIGMDHSSYVIWNDYVNFLKNVNAVGSYAENQKITAVRKVYQKGVVNPMANIEQFWKDYVSYEQGVNQIIAEKMTQDRSKDYMNARRVAKEYEATTRGLNRNAPAVPPSSDAEQFRQVDLWRKYVAWEKSNPLRYEDISDVIKRVEFAYEQSILCLGHYPDIWYEFASYLEESARKLEEKGDAKKHALYLDQAAAIFERATGDLLKGNILINFAWADFEEGRNKKEKATKIYTDLLEIVNINPTLVYVQYMKFARRAEGIKSARTIFKRAREDARCRYHIYSAAALMEYYCSKDKNVACRTFDLGLKKYPSEPGLILSFLDFLCHLNEENNTRVLFERALTAGSLSVEDSIEVWNRFLEFESNNGDLSSITKVEKRRAAAIEKLATSPPKTAWIVDRYKFGDLFPCSAQELRAIGYSNNLVAPSNVVTVGKVIVEESTTKSERPVPDFSQMVPFKPALDTRAAHGSHRVAGGMFPPPPAVGSLMAMLPHPQSFRGPFVGVNELMNLFLITGVLDGSEPRPEGVTGKVFAIANKAAHNFASASGDDRPIKRPAQDDEDEAEMGENSNSNSAPAFDVYRSRQLTKKNRF
ncbi:Cleavage stimulation factor subunit 3 [Halotydeus destructor]|nr:Cleavage stimulation factor subunit 3 [Halotydeus destructor]